MSKILLLEREFDLEDSLQILLEQNGHPTDWRQKPEEIKDAYDNPQNMILLLLIDAVMNAIRVLPVMN